MSLLDDHAVRTEGETWAVPDDPGDDVPLWWPDESDGDQAPPV